MSRPQKNRLVNEPPLFSGFKPIGMPKKQAAQIKISLDEFEAFRLADYMGMSHEEAAKEMRISRSTFTRLIEVARKKIADLIINGKILLIEGGNVHFKNNIIRCLDCRHLFRTEVSNNFSECPECDSDNLLNFAGDLGHGDCCKQSK